MQRAGRVVSWFVPGVLVAAALTLAVWLLLGEPRTALTCMVSVLIVACPCALGLATPTAILVGSGRGAEQGILIKNAQTLEQAGRIDTVVMDKTGTITLGQPHVVQLLPSHDSDPRQLLATAAAAEKLSGHPLAQAVMTAAAAQGVDADPAETLEVVPGEGIVCRHRGAEVVVGTEQLLSRWGVDLHALDRDALYRYPLAATACLFATHSDCRHDPGRRPPGTAQRRSHRRTAPRPTRRDHAFGRQTDHCGGRCQTGGD